MSRNVSLWLLAISCAAMIAVVLAQPPIPQPLAYHAFADQRTLLGIPHAWNVLTNLFFLLVGWLGLAHVRKTRSAQDHSLLWPHRTLFLGVAMVALGSAYYHLDPGNQRLVWDRLPMTLAFMSLLAAVIAERVDGRLGLLLLGPLLAAGLASVLYWAWSEAQGAGDLRPYLLAQFLPMLAIPLLILLFPPRYSRGEDLLAAVGIYGVAKVLELLDADILRWTGGAASGHSLKHLAAALAAYWILRMLVLRQPLESSPSRSAA